MGIFERMGRVASANFNALLDRADSPEKSLDLTLREMREQLRAARREVVRSLAAEKQLKNKVVEIERDVGIWSGRAELAVRHGKDELARDALAHKRRLAAERDRTEALRVQQRQNALEMKAEFERMERKMEEFSARQGTLAVLARQAAAGGGTDSLGAPAQGSPLSAWHDMEDRLDNIDAVFEAQREVDEALAEGRGPTGLTRAEVEAEFMALERGASGQGPASAGAEAVDEELTQLKKKYRIQT
jgi:phage shock protein A